MADLSEIGEFGLIERLAELIRTSLPASAQRSEARLLLGIGDDAAVWKPTPGSLTVVTTDTMVEGVHFRRDFGTWRDVGWKAMAVNVSDVAAMGAVPRYAVVTLGLPPGERLDDLLDLYRGIADNADRFEFLVVGGDVVSSPTFFVSATLTGESRDGTLLRRDGAAVGDVLAVTGTLGDSAGGLRLLIGGAADASNTARLLAGAHRRPTPRVAQAGLLVEEGVKAGMDLSDGLLGDSTRLARQSGVGVEIALESLPLSDALLAEFGDRAAEIALAGGEDYELLVAGRPEVIARAAARLVAEQDTPLTVVGNIVACQHSHGEVIVKDARGNVVEPMARSWEHPL